MKEKIYTIPVNEAFDKGTECPFCELKKKLESEILNYVLGPSYMEEDVREETDKLGFCKDHYRRMFFAGNKLGNALILETHLKKINAQLPTLFKEELNFLNNKKSLFKKDTTASPFEKFIQTHENSCYACNRINVRMNSYIDTFFHLWKTEEEFRDKVKSGKGFCLEHISTIISEGKKRLSAKDYKALLETALPIVETNMKRVEEELSWFVKKFDYRFKDEPWGNSKDAVERAIEKVSGTDLNEYETLK